MKRVIVTGATGYIGSHLTGYLVNEGFDVFAIVREGSDCANLDYIKEQVTIFKYNGNINILIEFFKEIRPEVVFHVAAAILSNHKPEQILTLINSNILFGTQLLEAMLYSNCKLLINTGSYWQNFNSDSYNPLDLYAATKEAFEKIIQYYVDAHQIRCITLRLFDVYGEDDKRPKLLNLLCKAATEGTSLDLSPGEQYLNLTHILDVCSAYLKSYELLIEKTSIANKIYGVYAKDKIQLKSLICSFQSIISKKADINLGGKEYRERELMNPCTKYEKLPNWENTISLEDGLKRLAIKYKLLCY